MGRNADRMALAVVAVVISRDRLVGMYVWVGHYFEGIDLVSHLSPVVHDMLSNPSLLGRVCINLSRLFQADADTGCMALSVAVYNTAL